MIPLIVIPMNAKEELLGLFVVSNVKISSFVFIVTVSLGFSLFVKLVNFSVSVTSISFIDNNISLMFQSVTPPTYQQLHGEFIPYLSALDVLLNKGEDANDLLSNMGGIQPFNQSLP